MYKFTLFMIFYIITFYIFRKRDQCNAGTSFLHILLTLYFLHLQMLFYNTIEYFKKLKGNTIREYWMIFDLTICSLLILIFSDIYIHHCEYCNIFFSVYTRFVDECFAFLCSNDPILPNIFSVIRYLHAHIQLVNILN